MVHVELGFYSKQPEAYRTLLERILKSRLPGSPVCRLPSSKVGSLQVARRCFTPLSDVGVDLCTTTSTNTSSSTISMPLPLSVQSPSGKGAIGKNVDDPMPSSSASAGPFLW